jgi:hypothetical protein
LILFFSLIISLRLEHATERDSGICEILSLLSAFDSSEEKLCQLLFCRIKVKESVSGRDDLPQEKIAKGIN